MVERCYAGFEFKALAEGFRHEQVNPAYGSKACPECDFVDKGNRNGDRFSINPRCGYEGHAYRIAATNYKRFRDYSINA